MVTFKHGIIHTFICAVYFTYICACTHILDVSKRGVLGSADGDIAFFPPYYDIFFWSWVDPLVFIGFSLF